MNSFLNFFRQYDWLLIIPVLILTAIGLAAIYSVDISRGTELQFFPTQMIALGLGIGVFLVSASLHRARYESMARLSYIAGLVLLIAVLFFGVEIRGTTGWFRFGGFSFQPAEFAKISLVLLLSWWTARQGRRFDRWEFIVSSTVAVALYAGLVMLQPDLGSALILIGIWFLLLLSANIPKRYTFGFIITGLAVIFLAWSFVLQEYQKDRVRTFLNPELDPLGSGYNVTQSLIAIGSGQLTGRGLGFGSQSQLHFLPEAQTDFILSVIGEELGFIGLVLVLVLYGIIVGRLLLLSSRAKDDFSAYALFGIAALLFIQAMINMGGATGLLPLTGVPLPFVSYGGSSLLMYYFLLGIAGSLARTGTESTNQPFYR